MNLLAFRGLVSAAQPHKKENRFSQHCVLARLVQLSLVSTPSSRLSYHSLLFESVTAAHESLLLLAAKSKVVDNWFHRKHTTLLCTSRNTNTQTSKNYTTWMCGSGCYPPMSYCAATRIWLKMRTINCDWPMRHSRAPAQISLRRQLSNASSAHGFPRQQRHTLSSCNSYRVTYFL
jgi:hypothetical protein